MRSTTMIRGPSSTMIVDPSGCGKTALTEALLTEGAIFQSYGGVWQPRFDTMKQHGGRSMKVYRTRPIYNDAMVRPTGEC